MSRHHAHRPDSLIEVRRRDTQPEQFLWRGRLYRVLEVLEHWCVSGSWWDVASLRSGGRRSAELSLAPLPPSPAWAQRAWGEPAPDVGVAVGPVSLEDEEREFWRVEAAWGRHASPGLFDLCFDASRGQWSLAGVLD